MTTTTTIPHSFHHEIETSAKFNPPPPPPIHSGKISMSSAEVVGSGGRSNFSQMCTLLSQYLKENGSFGELTLGLNHTAQKPKGSAAETMDLFPMVEKSGQGSDSGNPKMRDETRKNSFPSGPETAQMTIFYGGQVMVFDDLPANKANSIIDLAKKSSSAQNRPSAGFPLLHAVALKSESAGFGLGLSAQHHLDSDLPIARKNSLARFLEKRKDRITGNAPYPNPATKPRAEAWLGLAPELPLQTQRH